MPPAYRCQSDQDILEKRAKSPGRFNEFLFKVVIDKEQSIYGSICDTVKCIKFVSVKLLCSFLGIEYNLCGHLKRVNN